MYSVRQLLVSSADLLVFADQRHPVAAVPILLLLASTMLEELQLMINVRCGLGKVGVTQPYFTILILRNGPQQFSETGKVVSVQKQNLFQFRKAATSRTRGLSRIEEMYVDITNDCHDGRRAVGFGGAIIHVYKTGGLDWETDLVTKKAATSDLKFSLIKSRGDRGHC